MRISAMVLAAAVAGSGLGLGATWWEFQQVREVFARTSHEEGSSTHAVSLAIGGAQGKIVVANGETHDFGSMERESTRSHIFVLRNEGDGPVQIEEGKATCKCTAFTVSKKILAPGEMAEVRVEWKPNAYEVEFRQQAPVKLKNDAERSEVTLHIRGRVVQTVRPEPEQINVGDLPNTERREFELHMYGYREPTLEILQTKFDDADTAMYYEVTSAPLSPQELARENEAKCGLLVKVSVLPGLPLGPVRQSVRLTTNVAEGGVITLPVNGKVVSDIAVSGDGRFHAESGVLRLGPISRELGAKATLHLYVRGPHREKVQMESITCQPEASLRATLGAPRKLHNAVIYPLMVEVPAEAPPASYLGGTGGKLGKVIVHTTHPVAKQVQVLVQFAVTE